MRRGPDAQRRWSGEGRAHSGLLLTRDWICGDALACQGTGSGLWADTDRREIKKRRRRRRRRKANGRPVSWFASRVCSAAAAATAAEAAAARRPSSETGGREGGGGGVRFQASADMRW